MSWWRRMLGITSTEAAPEPVPRRLDPWAARVATIEIDRLPALLGDLRHEPAVVRRDVLRQVRLRLGDLPPVLLALARTRPADAEAIWTTLTTHPEHMAEACDALADLSTQVGTRQAWMERAAAAAPGDVARLQRCLGAAPNAAPPDLPRGPWLPLAERLPRQFTPRSPIARGPSGTALRVVSDAAWTAKGLHADLHQHPALGRVFADLRRMQHLDLKGIVSIVRLDVEQGCWIRTLGVATLADRPGLDLTAVSEAVEALHATGLTHGNICPQNIIVDAEGQARLTDLGVARLRGVTPSVDADLAAMAHLMEAR